jgi:hypothetical protein
LGAKHLAQFQNIKVLQRSFDNFLCQSQDILDKKYQGEISHMGDKPKKLSF